MQCARLQKCDEAVRGYRGRLAPSPTGYLHLGHAKTFWTAQQRAEEAGGTLILRNDDLDPARSRKEFVDGFIKDLKWFGCHWEEGPDVGGPHGPYNQSQRYDLYRQAFDRLKRSGMIYPCNCSRQDVLRSSQAPHHGEEEPIYPGTCRQNGAPGSKQGRINWRFRVPVGERIEFHDKGLGVQSFLAGQEFGDFVVWRHDGVPSYQLACVVDDAAMGITEVVRGADLLVSTARQMLIYEALGLQPPDFFHCSLLTDESGMRLAKRHDSLSIRSLREAGQSPERLRAGWESPKGAVVI